MTATFEVEDVARLLPMHMILGPGGEVLCAGPTLRKLIGSSRHLDDMAVLQRPHPDGTAPGATIHALQLAARSGERIFLRVAGAHPLVLRGHAASLSGDRVLINLGFGIGLVDAVRAFGLTDADFAPEDLAMEFLFLHEANRAVLAELSGFNTQLDEARREAELQAFTDPLTGLSNRRALELAMGLAVARNESGPDGSRHDFALAHVDLDHFKAVNDSLGHEAGDVVLCHVADVMRAATRAQDTVARVGGDEFILILPGVTRRDMLDSLLSRLIAQIEQPVATPAGEARVSASIGVALSRHYPDRPASHIHRDADTALYAAKNAGRGCWRLYEDSMG